MDSKELAALQQDYMKKVSETATRLGSEWEGILNRVMSGKPGSAGKGSPTSGKGKESTARNLPAPVNLPDSGSFSRMVSEMLSVTIKDLPHLVGQPRDRTLYKSVVRRWMEAYERFIGELLGLPEPSPAERFARSWNTFLQDATSVAMGLPTPFRPTGPKAPTRSVPTIGGGWPMQWPALTSGEQTSPWLPALPFAFGEPPARKQLKNAFEAQQALMKELTALHGKMVTASQRAGERFLKNIERSDMKQDTAQVYGKLLETWLDTVEKTFMELFRSDAFFSTVKRLTAKAGEAEAEKNGLVEQWQKSLKLPTRREMEDLQAAVESLSGRLRQLDAELTELRARVVQQEAAREREPQA